MKQRTELVKDIKIVINIIFMFKKIGNGMNMF